MEICNGKKISLKKYNELEENYKEQVNSFQKEIENTQHRFDAYKYGLRNYSKMKSKISFIATLEQIFAVSSVLYWLALGDVPNSGQLIFISYLLSIAFCLCLCYKKRIWTNFLGEMFNSIMFNIVPIMFVFALLLFKDNKKALINHTNSNNWNGYSFIICSYYFSFISKANIIQLLQ